MGPLIEPLTTVLLPVDRLKAFERTIPFIAVLAAARGSQLRQLNLLHVVVASYFSKHISNVDIRAGKILSSDKIRRIREQHYTDRVNPLMETIRVVLEQNKLQLPLKVLIKDGEPVKVICAECEDNNYSTLVLGRRDYTMLEESLMGSITRGVLDRRIEASIYLIGEEIEHGEPVLSRCMIGVNDSDSSRRAVNEAALLLSGDPDAVDNIALVHVIDQDCYFADNGNRCQEILISGRKCLDEAENIVLAAGIDRSRCSKVILFGNPARVLIDKAAADSCTLFFIGRRERSKLAKVFLGSVCSDIVQRCRQTIVALVN